MGNWTIVIKGHGPHGNNSMDDADFMAKDLVNDLEGGDHTLESATFQIEDNEPVSLLDADSADEQDETENDSNEG